MFQHIHPYEPFLFEEATKLIVGTLPPPRFTSRDLKEGDVDFCYGSRDGQLWPILNSIFKLNLKFETSNEAIEQRKMFLRNRKIGICDIVAKAERAKIDASDLGMQHIELRNIIGYLKEYKNVDTLIFTGGNSKNGPEYFFRRHLKEHNISLDVVSNKVPRIHSFVIPRYEESLGQIDSTGQIKKDIKKIKENLNKISPLPRSVRNDKERIIKTVSLTAPSGAANRAVGSLASYKKLKEENPDFNTFDFRVLQYAPFF